ncbi:carbamoyltransferase [bacterium]|nr:carbamoyltransferase [candidate division CSSED10-310 bacterium]
MNILGISCFYHDSAACLVQDGAVIAAASEERFTRIKHDHEFPHKAIRYCLAYAGLTIDDIDYIGFYDKPLVKFERILQTYLAEAPRGIRSFFKAIPLWLRKKMWMREIIARELEFKGPVLFSDHHLSHAASAFHVSPFEEAAILTVDGVGEWTTSSFGYGRDREIKLTHEIRFPHSLGLLYSAFTGYLGFKVNSGEYKVMGLAPYGEPRFLDKIKRELVELRDDGSFKLNMRYFAYTYGLTMVNRRFERLFGIPARSPESKLEKDHFDLAMSVQKITEEIMLNMAMHARRETGMRHLCLAGGVALNCVANGRVLREAGYDDIFIQPAAGDAGGALGAAMLIHHNVLGNPRTFRLAMPYFGPSFTDEEIKATLDGFSAEYHHHDRNGIVTRTARLIDEQNVVGWFQGRMEFGPRALGNRSILADPRDAGMQKKVNLKIKFRESFRPFAPTVLEGDIGEYFELDRPSPYMLLTTQVREDRRCIPAVTHVDGSARIQSIARDVNPLYYDVIAEFKRLSGVPVIINTSFNVRGEPIVCTPEDAYRCFMRTQMDYLVMGGFILDKKEQPALEEEKDWRNRWVLD